MFTKDNLILFQGDSITDACRSRETGAPGDAQFLGTGYVNHIAAGLSAEHPELSLKFVNKGISGNRIVDLYARWKSDAVNLNPSLISILIGVNDFWHEFGSQNGVEPDRYAKIYRMMLGYTLEKLPDVRLVLCEPFVLQTGKVTNVWIEDMKKRQEIVRKLAEDFKAVFVPFQRTLDECTKIAPPEYWLFDGVHPSAAGHLILANLWRKTVLGR